MKTFVYILAIASGTLLFSCEEKSAMEKLGDNIEETAESAKEAAEETAEKVDDEADKGEKKIKKLFK